MTSNNSGIWNPNYDFPANLQANYGLRYNQPPVGSMDVSIRNLVFGFEGIEVPLVGGGPNKSFPADLDFTVAAGEFSYFAARSLTSLLSPQGIFNPHATALSEAGPGTLHWEATTATLTIPVDFAFTEVLLSGSTPEPEDNLGLYFRFTGQIVATAPGESVPEASSMILLGLGSSILVATQYIRRRQSSCIQ